MITDEQRQNYKALLKEYKSIIKKVSKRAMLTLLANLSLGVVLGVLIVVIGAIFERNGILAFDSFIAYIALGFVLFFVFFVFQIVIHEAGHLIFGLISGYNFLSFRIFSLTLVKVDGRITRKKYSIKGTAGQCLMYPPTRKADGSFPYKLYNLGGGLANLIVSLPFLPLIIYIDNSLARTIFISFFISGILTAATNLIPMDLGIHNDGMNLVSLNKGRCYQDSFYLQLKVNAELSEGKLMTDYDPAVFDLPKGADDTNMLTAFNRFYLYYWYLAKHDFDAAYQLLMKMNEKISEYPIAIFNMLQAEKLFFMVLMHGPIEEKAVLYYRVRLLFQTAKTNMEILRIRYIYESILSEDDKKKIETLVKNKKQKKWKECDLVKLRQDIDRTAMNYPAIGEAAMNIDIIEYCIQNYSTINE